MAIEDIINILISIGGAFLIMILLHISFKLNTRKFFDKKSNEFKKKQLFSLLEDSQINTIKKAYYLCCTNATPKNLKDIYMFVRFRLYFMLEHMFSRMNRYVDEDGELLCFDPKEYQIFLTIDNFNNYKLIIVFEDRDEGYFRRIEDIIKVNRFLMWSTLWYFSFRELIFKA